ncbi:Nyctalopin-like protein, partial [Dinothrombium tinctorium]
IRYIEAGAFDSLISLEWLYINSNQLTSISNDVFYPILDSVKVFDLHDSDDIVLIDNPFVCDCSVVWFRDWIVSEGAGVVNMPKETKCNSPSDLQHKAIVDIPYNRWICNSSAFNTFETIKFAVF